MRSTPLSSVLCALSVLALLLGGCSEDGDPSLLDRLGEGNTIAPPQHSDVDASGNSSGADPTSGVVDQTGGEADGSFDVEPDPHGCNALHAEWPAEWKAFEAEVIRLVNERRSSPAQCGNQSMPATDVMLVADPHLTCASRLHSQDMASMRRLDHNGSDGRSPFQRISDIGYTGRTPQGENVAMGYQTPAAVVSGWMSSPGHCSNIMNAGFNEIGVGYDNSEPSYPHLWTQKFARR